MAPHGKKPEHFLSASQENLCDLPGLLLAIIQMGPRSATACASPKMHARRNSLATRRRVETGHGGVNPLGTRREQPAGGAREITRRVLSLRRHVSARWNAWFPQNQKTRGLWPRGTGGQHGSRTAWIRGRICGLRAPPPPSSVSPYSIPVKMCSFLYIPSPSTQKPGKH